MARTSAADRMVGMSFAPEALVRRSGAPLVDLADALTVVADLEAEIERQKNERDGFRDELQIWKRTGLDAAYRLRVLAAAVDMVRTARANHDAQDTLEASLEAHDAELVALDDLLNLQLPLLQEPT